MLSYFAFTSLSLLLSPPTQTHLIWQINESTNLLRHTAHIPSLSITLNEMEKKWKLMRVCARSASSVNVVNQITNKHFIALNKRIQIVGRIDGLRDRTVVFSCCSTDQIGQHRTVLHLNGNLFIYVIAVLIWRGLKRLQIRIQHLVCTCFSSSFQQTIGKCREKNFQLSLLCFEMFDSLWRRRKKCEIAVAITHELMAHVIKRFWQVKNQPTETKQRKHRKPHIKVKCSTLMWSLEIRLWDIGKCY